MMRTHVQVPSEEHALPADFSLDGSGRSEIGVSTLARTQKVAHICSDYLPLTETFIYSFLKNMRMYEPLVLANTMMNVNLFPLQQIVSIPQAPAAERVINKIVRMVGICPSTQYGTYFLTFSKKMRSMLIDLRCPQEKVESCPA